MAHATEHLGTGRRKSAVARVRLSNGNGKFIVNGRSVEDYFTIETHRMHIMIPLNTVNRTGQFDVRVNVCGGGLSGQAGAVRHGIARALLKADPEFRPALKKVGVLTRDPRAKERKKYGQPGARKRFQYSKR